MDLARAPRRAPLTARKKGSGYENGVDGELKKLGPLPFVEALKIFSGKQKFFSKM